MRKKYYLSLLTIPIIAFSLALMSMPVTAGDGDVTFDITAYFYATSGIIPGVDPDTTLPPYYGWVLVDVYVDASALTPSTGMHGWGLLVTVDPAVLTPQMAAGGSSGYFLYDWSFTNHPPPPFPPGAPMPYPPSFVSSVGADYIEAGEFYLPLPPDGATGVGKLCSLYFTSNSLTDYTELTIDVANSGYQDTSGEKYLINPVDGHYNTPQDAMFLEQYQGSTWPTGDPTGSDWHELEPVYCTDWTMESFNDNGDGVLSPSDQVDMMRSSDPEPIWFHVEWTNPYGTAGDGIADMWVTLKPDIPEFPLGSVAPLALIAAVAYIWWVSRRKRQEAV